MLNYLSWIFVPIVLEILDVFPTELSSVDQDRNINFVVDLELGTKPISISPYHMAPAMLKDQSQDFFSKVLIRSSVSPWITLVCEEE